MKMFLAVGFSLLTFLSSLAFAEVVDTTQFIQGILGQYQILKVAGEPAHDANKVAEVALEDKEAVFTFPYCVEGPNGFCDPGYLFFPLGETQVQLTAKGVDQASYLIEMPDSDGNRLFYTWEETKGTIRFVNHQYQYPDGSFVSLDFEVKK